MPAPPPEPRLHAQRAGPREEPAFWSSTPEGTRYSASGFQELQLSRPLVRACTALGFTRPTPIQVGRLLGCEPRRTVPGGA